MAIEDTLLSIDAGLKLIVTIMQSAGAMSAQAPVNTAPAATETVAEKKTRAKKDNSTNADAAAAMGLVAGDPEGTRYWVSESLRTVYAQNPGDADPTDQSFKIETAVHYSAKKEEFAKKNAQATAAPTTVVAETPVKTTPAASTASGAPDWKSVLATIQALNKSTEPGHGRDGVIAVLSHFGLAGQKVPALEALGKHAEIMAFVNKMLTPAGDESDDLGI